MILNNLPEPKKCEVCNSKIKFLGFSKGYQRFCSRKCYNSKEGKQILKREFEETCLRRFGVDHPWKDKSIFKKCQDTNLKKYGKKCPSQVEEFKEKAHETCIEKYSHDSFLKTEEFKKKSKESNLKRYGAEHPMSNKEIQQKRKASCLESLGVEFPLQDKSTLKKTQETNLKRYGSAVPINNPEFQEKIKKKNLEKYGVEFPSQNDVVKQKTRETCLRRFGKVSNLATKENMKKSHSKESFLKRHETMKQNHTLGSHKTKIEKETEEFLKSKFKNVFYQYWCDRYPFNCDFYVEDLDVFIEINAFYTHGTHPFDPSSKEDLKRLAALEESKKDCAIQVWTGKDTTKASDPLKRKIAKENNLNFLEIFSNSIEDVKHALEKFLNSNEKQSVFVPTQ